jgi:hypothetical protein
LNHDYEHKVLGRNCDDEHCARNKRGTLDES